VDSDYHPPLFISRSCFRHDSLHMECATCKDRRHTYTLEQQSRRYRVEVRDCMSHVYLDDQNRP
jgi:putative protease